MVTAASVDAIFDVGDRGKRSGSVFAVVLAVVSDLGRFILPADKEDVG